MNRKIKISRIKFPPSGQASALMTALGRDEETAGPAIGSSSMVLLTFRGSAGDRRDAAQADFRYLRPVLRHRRRTELSWGHSTAIEDAAYGQDEFGSLRNKISVHVLASW